MTRGISLEPREADRRELRCGLCPGPALGDGCYARIDGQERPVCRACWECLLLPPAEALRQLRPSSPKPIPQT